MHSEFHSPCERRVDGDRITELIPSREWLSGRVSGNRGPDVNPLVKSPMGFYPPALPRHMQRDHLHDRNREHSLYDPANPGFATYVRVTRRRHTNDLASELAVARRRHELREAEIAKESVESELKNELLDVRSRGLRNAMASRSRMQQLAASQRAAEREGMSMAHGRSATVETRARPGSAPPAWASAGGPLATESRMLAARATELERRIHVLATTPSIHAVNSALGGAPTAAVPPLAPRGRPSAPSPATPASRTKFTTRAGWPVHDNYYDA